MQFNGMTPAELVAKADALGRKFGDADVSTPMFDLATEFLAQYTGNFSYLLDVKETIRRSRRMTFSQARGILNCLVAQTRREMAQVEEKQAQYTTPDAGWVGTVGGKIDTTVTIDLVKWIERPESRAGGLTLVKMHDDAGKILTWFASKVVWNYTDGVWESQEPIRGTYTTRNVLVAEGVRVQIKGTIKAHNEFRGARETMVTRCSLVAVEAEEEVVEAASTLRTDTELAEEARILEAKKAAEAQAEIEAQMRPRPYQNLTDEELNAEYRRAYNAHPRTMDYMVDALKAEEWMRAIEAEMEHRVAASLQGAYDSSDKVLELIVEAIETHTPPTDMDPAVTMRNAIAARLIRAEQLRRALIAEAQEPLVHYASNDHGIAVCGHKVIGTIPSRLQIARDSGDSRPLCPSCAAKVGSVRQEAMPMV